MHGFEFSVNSLASLVNQVYQVFGGMRVIASNQSMLLSLYGNRGGTSLDQENALLIQERYLLNSKICCNSLSPASF